MSRYLVCLLSKKKIIKKSSSVSCYDAAENCPVMDLGISKSAKPLLAELLEDPESAVSCHVAKRIGIHFFISPSILEVGKKHTVCCYERGYPPNDSRVASNSDQMSKHLGT